MSEKTPPADIWGRSERTVIRPNPGARRPTAPANPSPPSQPSVSYPSPAAAAPAVTPAATQDEWILTPAPRHAQGPPPRSADLSMDELVTPNPNPILRAAGPLLLLLGRLRVALLRAPFASLMEQVAEAIKFFEKDIRS